MGISWIKSTVEDESNLSFYASYLYYYERASRMTAAIHKRDKQSVGRLGLNANTMSLHIYTGGKVAYRSNLANGISIEPRFESSQRTRWLAQWVSNFCSSWIVIFFFGLAIRLRQILVAFGGWVLCTCEVQSCIRLVGHMHADTKNVNWEQEIRLNKDQWSLFLGLPRRRRRHDRYGGSIPIASLWSPDFPVISGRLNDIHCVNSLSCACFPCRYCRNDRVKVDLSRLRKEPDILVVCTPSFTTISFEYRNEPSRSHFRCNLPDHRMDIRCQRMCMVPTLHYKWSLNLTSKKVLALWSHGVTKT